MVGDWLTEAADLSLLVPANLDYLAARAARWGADQELEACCEWVGKVAIVQIANNLRAARRPKPPSLKEQALALINSNKPYLDDTAMDTIRQALEQLND
jgi:predicted DNA-binding transcriptional regulator YafY